MKKEEMLKLLNSDLFNQDPEGVGRYKESKFFLKLVKDNVMINVNKPEVTDMCDLFNFAISQALLVTLEAIGLESEENSKVSREKELLC